VASVLWLPLTETFSLAVLLSLAQRRSLRWYAAAGIVGTVALLQCFTLFGECENSSRIPFAIMPLTLVVLSIVEILMREEFGANAWCCWQIATANGA
jgi:hypothetical protein